MKLMNFNSFVACDDELSLKNKTKKKKGKKQKTITKVYDVIIKIIHQQLIKNVPIFL